MSNIDPILLSVFSRAFKSITDEMSISLQKTTRSPILCEAKDFVTGLYDAPFSPSPWLLSASTSAIFLATRSILAT